MGEFDGAIAAVVVVIVIAALIAWLWIAWVGIGMLMVFFGMPSEFILHLFLWLFVMAVCSKIN